jgi:hypothetical protein
MRYDWETLSSGLDRRGTFGTYHQRRQYQIVTSVDDFLPLPRIHKTCCISIQNSLVLKEEWAKLFDFYRQALFSSLRGKNSSVQPVPLFGALLHRQGIVDI